MNEIFYNKLTIFFVHFLGQSQISFFILTSHWRLGGNCISCNFWAFRVMGLIEKDNVNSSLSIQNSGIEETHVIVSASKYKILICCRMGLCWIEMIILDIYFNEIIGKLSYFQTDG